LDTDRTGYFRTTQPPAVDLYQSIYHRQNGDKAWPMIGDLKHIGVTIDLTDLT